MGMLTEADDHFPAGPTIWKGSRHRDAGARGAALNLPRGRAWQVTGGTLWYCCLAVTQGSPGLGSEGRISDTMSHATADRYAWAQWS